MWLQECFKLYPDITQLRLGQRYDLLQVEREVRQARSGCSVDAQVLQIIENSTGWTYPSWWPPFSEKIKEPIALPANLFLPNAKQEAVKLVHSRLRHIEVVSVVLRFLCPDEFGILSPPVMNLVNLPRARSHVELYGRYLSLLVKLRDHYGVLGKAAHVDMALWSAANLDSIKHRSLWEEILHDAHFQEICLSNMLEGFGTAWGQTDRERLMLAEMLLRHDYILSALIAARCFEAMVHRMARRWNVSPTEPTQEAEYLSALVHKMANCKQRELSAMGLSPFRLTHWLHLRNRAVHVRPPITREEAKEFVPEVKALLSRVEGN